MASYLKTSQPETPTVEMTIPLMIRILELAREEIKSDIGLHKVVEVILALAADDRTLNMDDYEKISFANT